MTRILFAFAGGQGHLDPLLPLARAAAAAGHDVAVTGRAELVPVIREHGFEAIESPGDQPDPAARMPLKPYDPVDEVRALREWYAGTLARRRVSQGGSGIAMGALSRGLPSVLLPIGADQPHTAAVLEERGAALVLDPIGAASDDIAAAVRTVLDDPAYTAAARRVRAEIRSLPGSDLAIQQMLDCKI